MSDASSAFKGLAAGVIALALGMGTLTDAQGSFNPAKIKYWKTPNGGGGSTPTPTPTPTPTTTTVLPELTMIPSNFDVASELTPSWGSGAIPVSNAPDNVGAFRFLCNAGQIIADDPIVYPNQPGKSHLHQFFGNTSANANSTYDSLRKTGESTCMSPVNRSAYWMPAMLNGRGQVVRPDYVSIYYKRMPESDPNCQTMGKACVGVPNGLRYIMGYNMSNPSSTPAGVFHYNCDGPGAGTGTFSSITAAAPTCPTGAQLIATIDSPPCWDGINLDSPDHRSHMTYPSYGWWGYRKCPDTHPYVLPDFTLRAFYMTDDTLDRSGTFEPGKTVTWSMASDNMPGMAPAEPGTTFHADWFGAWDNSVLAAWQDNCINRKLNCSGGDLGNGKQMKQSWPFTWNANPRLVPVPN